MTSNTLQFRPPADQVPIDAREVCRAMGCLEEAPPGILELVEQLRMESLGHLDFACGCRILPARVARDVFFCEQRAFSCGKIVAAGLQHSTSVAFFVATLGERIEAWSRGFFSRGDPLAGYVADTIGAVAVEALVDWLWAEIGRHAEAGGNALTNRYSPGYCEWNVAEQQRLFALLPHGFCGVHLRPSSLMVPLKSASGVIGIGAAVRKLDYECQVCSMEQCLFRGSGKRGGEGGR